VTGRTGGELRGAKDLLVYQKAYALAMEIFRFSKAWPTEEKYSLNDQTRFEDAPVLYARISAKRGPSAGMRRISSANLRMRMGKTERRIPGWILRATVGTWPRLTMRAWSSKRGKSARCWVPCSTILVPSS